MLRLEVIIREPLFPRQTGEWNSGSGMEGSKGSGRSWFRELGPSRGHFHAISRPSQWPGFRALQLGCTSSCWLGMCTYSCSRSRPRRPHVTWACPWNLLKHTDEERPLVRHMPQEPAPPPGLDLSGLVEDPAAAITRVLAGQSRVILVTDASANARGCSLCARCPKRTQPFSRRRPRQQVGVTGGDSGIRRGA